MYVWIVVVFGIVDRRASDCVLFDLISAFSAAESQTLASTTLQVQPNARCASFTLVAGASGLPSSRTVWHQPNARHSVD